MVIEVLEASCPLELREAFLVRDAETWTAALSRQPGFISKEVWASREDPSLVILVIRWETMAHWQAFPNALAHALDEGMGELLLPLKCHTYETLIQPTADGPARG